MNDSQKLDLLLVKFDGMNSDIQILKEDVSSLKKDVASLDKRVTKLERGQSELKELCLKNQSDIAEVRELCLKNQSDITEIRSDITEIRSDITEIRSDITDIKLTLENEIRTNIRLIAEGHLDLSRQLHDALHTSNEFENMKVRVNSLEADMKRVKRKVFV